MVESHISKIITSNINMSTNTNTIIITNHINITAGATTSSMSKTDIAINQKVKLTSTNKVRHLLKLIIIRWLKQLKNRVARMMRREILSAVLLMIWEGFQNCRRQLIILEIKVVNLEEMECCLFRIKIDQMKTKRLLMLF